jgi:hypothetical protein
MRPLTLPSSGFTTRIPNYPKNNTGLAGAGCSLTLCESALKLYQIALKCTLPPLIPPADLFNRHKDIRNGNDAD